MLRGLPELPGPACPRCAAGAPLRNSLAVPKCGPLRKLQVLGRVFLPAPSSTRGLLSGQCWKCTDAPPFRHPTPGFMGTFSYQTPGSQPHRSTTRTDGEAPQSTGLPDPETITCPLVKPVPGQGLGRAGANPVTPRSPWGFTPTHPQPEQEVDTGLPPRPEAAGTVTSGFSSALCHEDANQTTRPTCKVSIFVIIVINSTYRTLCFPVFLD